MNGWMDWLIRGQQKHWELMNKLGDKLVALPNSIQKEYSIPDFLPKCVLPNSSIPMPQGSPLALPIPILPFPFQVVPLPIHSFSHPCFPPFSFSPPAPFPAAHSSASAGLGAFQWAICSMGIIPNPNSLTQFHPN